MRNPALTLCELSAQSDQRLSFLTTYTSLYFRISIAMGLNEPGCEKTGIRGFRPGLTQTGLYSNIRWLEACNFGLRK